MQTDVLIIGGGLAGLTAAWNLEKQGIDYRLAEVRSRFGGRVHTVPGSQRDFDLGPSWIWPGQPAVAELLREFSLGHFLQPSDGDLVYQDQTGKTARYSERSPMAGAYRISGGTGALVDALVGAIPQDRLFLNRECLGLSQSGQGIQVRLGTSEGSVEWEAQSVTVAVPPRLAANLAYSPELGRQLLNALRGLPTWMASHAKILTLYDKPFWRENGLSGSAMSAKGPLGEIHDASPQAGGPYALFGFVALTPSVRKDLGSEALQEQALNQLVELFGEEAGKPLDMVLHDWSQEPWTADPRDHQPLLGHPQYGLGEEAGNEWAGRLHFISSETATLDGGLIEGAIKRASVFAQKYAMASRS